MTPLEELKTRAFFAVRQGSEEWELIRDLASALVTCMDRIKAIEANQKVMFIAGYDHGLDDVIADVARNPQAAWIRYTTTLR